MIQAYKYVYCIQMPYNHLPPFIFEELLLSCMSKRYIKCVSDELQCLYGSGYKAPLYNAKSNRVSSFLKSRFRFCKSRIDADWSVAQALTSSPTKCQPIGIQFVFLGFKWRRDCKNCVMRTLCCQRFYSLHGFSVASRIRCIWRVVQVTSFITVYASQFYCDVADLHVVLQLQSQCCMTSE